MDELLLLFQYPPRSSRALLAGTLPLRYCAARFASKVPTWRLPVSGHAFSPVTAGPGVADGEAEVASLRLVSSSGPGRKNCRQNRENPAHLAGSLIQSRPRVWKRLRHVEHLVVSYADCMRRRYD